MYEITSFQTKVHLPANPQSVLFFSCGYWCNCPNIQQCTGVQDRHNTCYCCYRLVSINIFCRLNIDLYLNWAIEVCSKCKLKHARNWYGHGKMKALTFKRSNFISLLAFQRPPCQKDFVVIPAESPTASTEKTDIVYTFQISNFRNIGNMQYFGLKLVITCIIPKTGVS